MQSAVEALCNEIGCRPERLHEKLNHPLNFNKALKLLCSKELRTNYLKDEDGNDANRAVVCGGISKKSARKQPAYNGAIDNMTVYQHFYGKRKIELVYRDLPCLIVRGGKSHKDYIPLELINVTDPFHFEITV